MIAEDQNYNTSRPLGDRSYQSRYTGTRGRVAEEAQSSDDEHSTENNRNAVVVEDSDEEESAIPFFKRPKGPKFRDMPSIKPSDPLFDRLMNYKFYRLQRRSHRRTHETMMETNRKMQSLDLILKEHKFSQ